MLNFGGIEILQNAWLFAGIWIVALVMAAVLQARQKQAPATLLIVPILFAAHFGGWFDLRTLLRSEGLPIWAGVGVYAFGCLGYALWCGWQEIQVNTRERAKLQKSWFREQGLVYTEGSPSIPPERKEELKAVYANWAKHYPIFEPAYVEQWYSHHKMQLFWWAYFFPIDLVTNIFGKHLREFFLWVLSWKILRVPFDYVSKYHFDEYDLEFRRLLAPVNKTDEA